jgi:mRNA interferase HicA
MDSNEFKQWLAAQGAEFQPGQGTHIRVYLNGRQSVLPTHGAKLKTDTINHIKKQLGLN